MGSFGNFFYYTLPPKNLTLNWAIALSDVRSFFDNSLIALHSFSFTQKINNHSSLLSVRSIYKSDVPSSGILYFLLTEYTVIISCYQSHSLLPLYFYVLAFVYLLSIIVPDPENFSVYLSSNRSSFECFLFLNLPMHGVGNIFIIHIVHKDILCGFWTFVFPDNDQITNMKKFITTDGVGDQYPLFAIFPTLLHSH